MDHYVVRAEVRERNKWFGTSRRRGHIGNKVTMEKLQKEEDMSWFKEQISKRLSRYDLKDLGKNEEVWRYLRRR